MTTHAKMTTRLSFLAAAALVVAATQAHAADLGGQRMQPAAFPPVDSLSPPSHRHFYVRGDVGVGRYGVGSLSQQELADNTGSFLSSSIGNTVIVGAGIGVQVAPQFRIDLTGEYRSTADFKALDNVSVDVVDPAGRVQANTLYQGDISAYVAMLNGYWDLFKWRGITPYVGAGIGLAQISAGNFTTQSSASFTDAATGVSAVEFTNGYTHKKSETNLAWSLMAGASFDIQPNAKLDIGYRYLNLGSGVSLATGLINCVCGTTGSPLNVSDLESHEFRIGMRWMLDDPRQSIARPLK